MRKNAGATIVLALAVFLILTVFSSVMLTGSITALRNATRQRAEEQLYLSAASAAALLQKRVCGDGANVPYVEKVKISYDTSAYDNSSPEDKALMDSVGVMSSFEANKKGVRTGANLPDDSDSEYLLYGYLPGSDSIASSPELYATPPDSHIDTQDLVTYALCKMLKELSGSFSTSSDYTITIGVPTASGDIVPTVSDYMQLTSANLSMKKEGSEEAPVYLLTAILTTIKPETPSSEKATYVSKWTFSCKPRPVPSSPRALPYNWTNDAGFEETVWLYANIEKTVYKWKFETAERGEAQTAGG